MGDLFTGDAPGYEQEDISTQGLPCLLDHFLSQ